MFFIFPVYLLIIISLIVILEFEVWPFALFEMLVVIPLLAWFIFSINIYTILFSNLYIFSACFIGYFILGAIWSLIKWYGYCNSEYVRDKIKSSYVMFKEANPTKSTEDFYNSSLYNPIHRGSKFSLSHKLNWKIFNWIIMWPVSVLWTLIRNVTVDITKNIMKHLSGIYTKIGNKAVKGLD